MKKTQTPRKTLARGIPNAPSLSARCDVASFGCIPQSCAGPFSPVARFLITRYGLAPNPESEVTDTTGFEQPKAVRLITADAVIETVALIAVCLAVGSLLASWLNGTAFELPAFVCVLFVGVVLRNGLAVRGWYQVFERAVSLLGNVSLGLFLAIALMSLRLGDLASLALPLFAILVVQAIAMAVYATFVTFRVMGRNYDAAVLAAGHCGFGLGATPTAIANMQAITERFGPSHLAFLVVPMVGAFFHRHRECDRHQIVPAASNLRVNENRHGNGCRAGSVASPFSVHTTRSSDAGRGQYSLDRC